MVGKGGSRIRFTITSGTPASIALSIAIRSALGSTRTDSVASTTGRARVGDAERSGHVISTIPELRHIAQIGDPIR